MNKDMYDKGLAVRRAVLGDAYVDKALNTADDFNRPLQDLVTEYCWGSVWGRDGLPRLLTKSDDQPSVRRRKAVASARVGTRERNSGEKAAMVVAWSTPG